MKKQRYYAGNDALVRPSSGLPKPKLSWREVLMLAGTCLEVAAYPQCWVNNKADFTGYLGPHRAILCALGYVLQDKAGARSYG